SHHFRLSGDCGTDHVGAIICRRPVTSRRNFTNGYKGENIMNLKGKVAVVTVGNSGIRMAIVLELAKQGANIVIDYVAHPEAEQELEARVHALGDRAIGVKADVSQYSELQKLFAAAVEEFGRVDIMVNNAGVETRTSILDTT